MSGVPSLKTSRLILSAFAEGDAADVFAYAKNPAVAAMVTWDAHRSVEDSLGFIRFVQDKLDFLSERPFLAWAIRDPEKGNAAIGSISFSQRSSHGGQIDYALSEEYWGRGLMTEAALAVRNFAFQNYPSLIRLQASCLTDNLGSRKVMEKVGMAFEGIARSGMIVKGKPVDIATYAILRSDLSG